MDRHRARPEEPAVQRTLLALGSLVCLLLPRPAAATETVPMAQAVKPYIGDGLELAVTPWPQEAELSDRLLAVAGIEVEAQGNYAHPYTLKDANRFAGPKPAGGVKLHLGE